MFEIYWSAARAGMDMFQTSLKLGETLVASRDVIDTRVEIMKAAAANPLTGDYRELSLMVPEKVEAFSKAGAVLGKSWWGMQRDAASHFQHMASMMMRGGLPTAVDLQTISRRGARTTARAVAAAGAALAPVHKAATANARRLNKAKSKTAKKR
jgi:hypothetical protein